ncbi:MAG: hypothetical protein ACI4WT_03965 [Oligosphaeraceae bacterium]
MQETIFYVAAGETLGSVRDFANAKSAAAPTLVRGVSALLRMRLFAHREGLEPYPIDALDGIVRWQWAMDTDFSEATAYRLQADHANIRVGEVTDEIDGDEYTYTEVSIPMPEMNTVELVEWIGTDRSRSGLHGELVGYDDSGAEVFILQVENFTLRNRITSLGEPTPVSPDYLTASQVAALIAAGLDCQFSTDGERWRPEQDEGDVWLRLRVANSSGPWSGAILLPRGPQGAPGRDSCTFIAYAQDADGSGFSLTPANSRKWRAEIHLDHEPEALTAADFAGKWVKYIGDDGAGVGDMRAEVYDTDGDGVVDRASRADEADAVAWGSVTGKPEGFAPAAHRHAMADISDPVRQRTRSEANPTKLLLDTPVIINTATQGGPELAIDFPAILVTEGGDPYAGQPGDCLTWEYHVRCSSEIASVALGGLQCTMEAVTIPVPLPLVGDAPTWHVFAIRGLYRSGAANNLLLQVNYGYSYGG